MTIYRKIEQKEKEISKFISQAIFDTPTAKAVGFTT